MEFEQILIRLGLDYRAVQSGLQRAGSFIKAWATNLAHDLQHHVLGSVVGMVLVERVLGMLEKVGEKALFIRRLTRETGLSSNFMQGAINELGFQGEDFEKLEKPLGKLNALIGQAKMGIPEARQKFIDWGIVMKGESFNALNMTLVLQRMKEQFDKLGDKQKQAAFLQTEIGKSFQAFVPIFELSKKQFNDLFGGNFFTKLSPLTIETFAQLSKTGKSAFNVGSSILGNVAGGIMALNPAIMIARMKDLTSLMIENKKLISPKQIEEFFQTGHIQGLHEAKKVIHETTEEMIEQLKVQEQINERTKLQNQLLDRNKLTVHALAERAREITGDKRPRGLKAIHGVTPAMRMALQAEDLELAAQQATAMGRGGLATELQSRADDLRKNNVALTSVEQDPTKEIRQKLDIISKMLERVAAEGLTVKAENH